jgi:hypothetical protein
MDGDVTIGDIDSVPKGDGMDMGVVRTGAGVSLDM